MDSTVLWLAVTLTVASFYFGAATFALRELSRARLADVLDRRGRGDRLARIVEGRSELMMATAVLRLLANVGLILVTTALFRDRIENLLAHYATVLTVSGGVILVFGLAVPNALAKYAGEELVVTTYFVLAFCRVVIKPITWMMQLTDEIVRRLAGAPRPDETDEAEQIEQEILEAVSEGEAHGAVDETEKEMIVSVIELRDTHAGQIMTPRTEVIGLDVTAEVGQARRLILKEGHSRIPLYEETLDRIIGVLYAKDLLQIENDDGSDLASLMRQVPFVPESKPLHDLLKEFQETKVHLAIVIDEYGGTAGVVTFEDVLEELVGEIVDEYEPPEPEFISRIDEATIEANAKLRIDEVNDELDIELPQGKDYDTIGGFVLSELGKVPEAGEELAHDNVRIHVLDADDRRINRLRVVVDRSQRPKQNGAAD